MKALIAALALATLIAVPTFAQPANAAPMSPASSSFGSNGYWLTTNSSQAADAQAQTDSFTFAPQRLTPDATSGKTLRPSARRGRKGWIALHRPDGEVVYIKVDQIVFVISAKDTGAAERARSKVQLLAGHSDVRESVEEVMQTIENDGSLAKDGIDMSSDNGGPLSRPDVDSRGPSQAPLAIP